MIIKVEDETSKEVIFININQVRYVKPEGKEVMLFDMDNNCRIRVNMTMEEWTSIWLEYQRVFYEGPHKEGANFGMMPG